MPFDPVCGMQVNEDESLSATYEGQTYYFCSEDCRDEFMEAPDEYAGEGAGMLIEDEE